MPKSVAEEIRSLMNKIEEAGRRSYDLYIEEVENWLEPPPGTDPEDESFPYYLELGVDYSIYGEYVPARIRYDDYDHPAEYPELDEYRVYYAGEQPFMSAQGEVRPGQEFQNLPDWLEKKIEEEIWHHYENREPDYDPPYDDRY